MSDSPFSGPASSTGIEWMDHKDRLLLIEPISVETGISTTFGEKDAVRADVTVIDADGAPEVYPDALIFPGVLISQTRSLIGAMVLGRLGQGQAKSGQKPPWRLEDPTLDDIEIGKKYLKYREELEAKAKPASPFAKADAGTDSEPPF